MKIVALVYIAYLVISRYVKEPINPFRIIFSMINKLFVKNSTIVVILYIISIIMAVDIYTKAYVTHEIILELREGQQQLCLLIVLIFIISAVTLIEFASAISEERKRVKLKIRAQKEYEELTKHDPLTHYLSNLASDVEKEKEDDILSTDNIKKILK